MKVLFYYRGVESLGVGYLMSVLKADGHDVHLLFDPGLDDNLYVRLPWLAFLNRQGKLIAKAKAFDPDLVAFSCTSNLFPATRHFMHALRPHLEAPFVIGGIHATILPEYTLEKTPASFACVGEGERPLKQLVKDLRNTDPPTGIAGLYVKGNGSIQGGPAGPLLEDLDQIPFPEKDAFFRYGCFRSRISVLTSRGCPFHCTYCSNDLFFRLHPGSRGRVRRRSPDNVIQELHILKKRFPARSFWFCDDVFAMDRKWLEQFLEQYLTMGPLPFDCHIHPQAVDPERISLLKKAGCRHIFLGVDSGDERIRSELMGRPMSEKRIREAVSQIKEKGIKLTVSAIFGLPEEGPKEMQKTLAFCSTLGADGTSAYIFYPFYGTDLFEFASKHGYLSDESVEMIKQGVGSYHHESLLDHPFKELADTYSKLTPVYAKAPRVLRRLLDVIIRRRAYRTAAILYVLFTPLVFPVVGITWLADTFRMAWKANRS